MTRRELREHIFNELFTSDFYLASDEDLMAQLDLYFTHAGGDGLDYSPQDVPEEEREEVKKKAMAVCEKREEIDRILDERVRRLEDRPHEPGGSGGPEAGRL